MADVHIPKDRALQWKLWQGWTYMELAGVIPMRREGEETWEPSESGTPTGLRSDPPCVHSMKYLLGRTLGRQHPTLLQLAVQQGLHAIALPIASETLQLLQVLTLLGQKPLWACQKAAPWETQTAGNQHHTTLPRLLQRPSPIKRNSSVYRGLHCPLLSKTGDGFPMQGASPFSWLWKASNC